jgi:non-ribosomal peptide synthetase component E (peptide arylation enzyme)
MTEGKLAHFKIPRYIYLCDQFPLTVTGKVKKNVMRDEMNVMLEQDSPKVLKFAAHKNRVK